MMAGCAAALTTQTGKIGYLGPLVNDETRRLAVSAYLGARYAWTQVLKKDPRKLKFKVTWIGFWFNIPGQTLDPAKVAADFFNTGATWRDGSIPVNVSGGLLSKGHPLGATGIANIYEVSTHLRAEAGKRQVPNARFGLTHVIGLGSACAIHVLEKVA